MCNTQSWLFKGSIVRALRFMCLRRKLVRVNSPLLLAVDYMNEGVIRPAYRDHLPPPPGASPRDCIEAPGSLEALLNSPGEAATNAAPPNLGFPSLLFE